MNSSEFYQATELKDRGLLLSAILGRKGII